MVSAAPPESLILSVSALVAFPLKYRVSVPLDRASAVVYTINPLCPSP